MYIMSITFHSLFEYQEKARKFIYFMLREVVETPKLPSQTDGLWVFLAFVERFHFRRFVTSNTDKQNARKRSV